MRFLMFSLAALTLAGCADHPVDQVEGLIESVDEQLCRCPTLAGEDFCTMPARLTSAEKSCRRRVYDEYEGELADNFDCRIDALEQLDRCLGAAACDLAAVEYCLGAAQARVSVCPETTEAASEALDACDLD